MHNGAHAKFLGDVRAFAKDVLGESARKVGTEADVITVNVEQRQDVNGEHAALWGANWAGVKV